MPRVLNVTKHHSGSNILAGDRNDDIFTVNIPVGETFDTCNLTITSARRAGASVSAQPAHGATGTPAIKVHWFFDAGGSVDYQLEAFASNGAPQAIGPSFLPSVNGFHFNNEFPPRPDVTINVPPIGSIGIGDASNGLCGGMVYAARDFFDAALAIPGDTNPPNGGPLFDYLVRRLGESFDIPAGVATYQALMNPSLPDHETDLSRLGVGPHGRAWVAIREEWPKIKSDLDAHRLSPIGLICLRSNDPRDLGKNHQVMAYAYSAQGDRVTISIYDPNKRNDDTVRLSFNQSTPENTTAFDYYRPVLCFFHTNYHFSAPPAGNTAVGRLILFEDSNFGGRFKVIDSGDPDLTASDGGYFNDRVSSLAIFSGNWNFFKDVRFQNAYANGSSIVKLGPGLYPNIAANGIATDDMSSVRAI